MLWRCNAHGLRTLNFDTYGDLIKFSGMRASRRAIHRPRIVNVNGDLRRGGTGFDVHVAITARVPEPGTIMYVLLPGDHIGTSQRS